MPELTRLPADCSADDIVEINERDGGVIVDGWLSADLLSRFNAELDPLLAAHTGTNSGSEMSDAFLGHNTRRIQGLCAKAPSFVEIMLDERLLTFARAVMGPISPTIILNDGEVIDIGPGEDAQFMHRDDDAWNFVKPTHPMIVNTIAALVDITPAMGGTLVVPGSHRWEPDRQPTDDEITACDLPAGSTLFFRGDTLHAGGANATTDKRRRALSTGFCCGWLRPVENSYTNVPPAIAATLPREAQELLGYALYDASEAGGGYLGYHEMGDPMALFAD
jgi:ectoine hydroxylase-related dioxygenase (phytanoyl-CoA dioxygenase family)